MVKNYIYFFLIPIIFSFLEVRSQDDLGDFLIADLDDASRLVSNYISPLSKGFGYSANNGWYNSASPHSMGFDFTITATAAYVPSKDLFSLFIENEYNDLQLLSPTDNKVPTVFGPEDIVPQYMVSSTGETFEGPPGNSLKEEFGFEAVILPMIQLGIGVIPNTDVKVRYMPLVEFDDDFEAKMWGVGLLHRINDYFPSGDELLVDISLLAAYTQIDTEIQISETYPGEDQLGVQKLKSWTIEGVVSYDLSVLTFYGGLGYNTANSNLDVLGTYDIGSEVLDDPISISDSFNGLKATLGLRIKLAVFTLHGDYTLGEYNRLSVGVGLSVN